MKTEGCEKDKTAFSKELILNIIMNNSQDTIYFKDRESKFVLSSKAHMMQFGLEDPKDLEGKSDFDFFPEEFAQSACDDELKIMETGVPIVGRVEKWVKKDGSEIWFSASKYPFVDGNGTIIGTWGTSTNITALKNTEQELARVNKKLELVNKKLVKQSNIDGLSGLYNQNFFYETIEDTISTYRVLKNKEKTFSVLMMDIDNFKLINDTYGHLVGDQAIKHVADLISDNTRKDDQAFRNGGDEFAVILFNTGHDSAFNLAKRICESAKSAPIKSNDMEISITISIGVAAFSNEESVEELIRKVDEKLYQAKRNGKNQVS